MKPTKCSAIRRKEKNTISTENNMEKTGKKLNSLKKPAVRRLCGRNEDPDNQQIHFQILEVNKILVKDNILIFLNRCLVPEQVARDHAIQNSGDRIIRRNYIFHLRDAAKTHSQTLTVNEKNIRITIPAGVEDGQVIRLKNHGAPGANGGPNGDLYITFRIEPDPVFKRSGNDLYITLNLDLYTAVLGGEVMVDTLDGKIKLKVKPETQNGTKSRLKGKGFPVYKKDGTFGDLFVTYNILIPQNLTPRQKELFTELSKMK